MSTLGSIARVDIDPSDIFSSFFGGGSPHGGFSFGGSPFGASGFGGGMPFTFSRSSNGDQFFGFTS